MMLLVINIDIILSQFSGERSYIIFTVESETRRHAQHSSADNGNSNDTPIPQGKEFWNNLNEII